MKLNNLFFYVFVILCVVAKPVRADMYVALQHMYDDNPTIAEQRAAVNAADANVGLAATDAKPYLGITGGAGIARTQLFGQEYDYNPTEIGIVAQQNIFKGGAMWAQIGAAKSILKSQQAVLYATEQKVFLSAINAYIEVLNASEVLKLNQNNQKVLQEYYDYVKDNANVGNLTKTDVAQASARLAGAKYQVSDAQTRYDNAVETFRQIYGTTESKYDDIDMTRLNGEFPSDIVAAEEKALKNHPTILALESQRDAARKDITIARQTILPSIDVRASLSQYDDLPILDRVRDGRVGIYLTMPLYDKGAAFNNVDKARFTVAGIDQQIIESRRAIVANLRQAWNTYNAQTDAIAAAESNLKAGKLALAGVKDAQKRGRRTVLDVLNAEQEVLNAQVDLVRAKHGKESAYFAILAATGNLSAKTLGIKEKSDE